MAGLMDMLAELFSGALPETAPPAADFDRVRQIANAQMTRQAPSAARPAPMTGGVPGLPGSPSGPGVASPNAGRANFPDVRQIANAEMNRPRPSAGQPPMQTAGVSGAPGTPSGPSAAPGPFDKNMGTQVLDLLKQAFMSEGGGEAQAAPLPSPGATKPAQVPGTFVEKGQPDVMGVLANAFGLPITAGVQPDGSSPSAPKPAMLQPPAPAGRMGPPPPPTGAPGGEVLPWAGKPIAPRSAPGAPAAADDSAITPQKVIDALANVMQGAAVGDSSAPPIKAFTTGWAGADAAGRNRDKEASAAKLAAQDRGMKLEDRDLDRSIKTSAESRNQAKDERDSRKAKLDEVKLVSEIKSKLDPNLTIKDRTEILRNATNHAKHLKDAGLSEEEIGPQLEAFIRKSEGYVKDGVLSDSKAPAAGAPAAKPALPSAGEVRNGYRFKGGDPGDQKNWEPAN
jgi:hypothetical protein